MSTVTVNIIDIQLNDSPTQSCVELTSNSVNELLSILMTNGQFISLPVSLQVSVAQQTQPGKANPYYYLGF